jgi:hypothetical protein
MTPNPVLIIGKLLSLLIAGHVGLATTFKPVDDPWNPDPHLACYGRDLRSTDMVVAHPSLPCRSKVFLYSTRTHRSVVAVVGDRGPRHAMVDLAPATARALRSNGYETVFMVPVGATAAP